MNEIAVDEPESGRPKSEGIASRVVPVSETEPNGEQVSTVHTSGPHAGPFSWLFADAIYGIPVSFFIGSLLVGGLSGQKGNTTSATFVGGQGLAIPLVAFVASWVVALAWKFVTRSKDLHKLTTIQLITWVVLAGGLLIPACYGDLATLTLGSGLYGISGWKPTAAQVLTARGLSFLLLLPLFWLRKVVDYSGRVSAELAWGIVYAAQFPIVLGLVSLSEW